jgi:hypothetical protein
MGKINSKSGLLVQEIYALIHEEIQKADKVKQSFFTWKQ